MAAGSCFRRSDTLRRLATYESGDPRGENITPWRSVMEQQNVPPSVPKDATEATEEQRLVQKELEHQDDDPNALGRHQDRHDMADET